MAARAKQAAVEIDSARQLELLDHAFAEPRRAREPRAAASPSSTKPSTGGRRTLPRLTVSPGEAAEMLGISRDFFDEHIKPELRIVRRGSRTILIPVVELERWVDQSAARWFE